MHFVSLGCWFKFKDWIFSAFVSCACVTSIRTDAAEEKRKRIGVKRCLFLNSFASPCFCFDRGKMWSVAYHNTSSYGRDNGKPSGPGLTHELRMATNFLLHSPHAKSLQMQPVVPTACFFQFLQPHWALTEQNRELQLTGQVSLFNALITIQTPVSDGYEMFL